VGALDLRHDDFRVNFAQLNDAFRAEFAQFKEEVGVFLGLLGGTVMEQTAEKIEELQSGVDALLGDRLEQNRTATEGLAAQLVASEKTILDMKRSLHLSSIRKRSTHLDLLDIKSARPTDASEIKAKGDLKELHLLPDALEAKWKKMVQSKYLTLHSTDDGLRMDTAYLSLLTGTWNVITDSKRALEFSRKYPAAAPNLRDEIVKPGTYAKNVVWKNNPGPPPFWVRAKQHIGVGEALVHCCACNEVLHVFNEAAVKGNALHAKAFAASSSACPNQSTAACTPGKPCEKCEVLFVEKEMCAAAEIHGYGHLVELYTAESNYDGQKRLTVHPQEMPMLSQLVVALDLGHLSRWLGHGNGLWEEVLANDAASCFTHSPTHPFTQLPTHPPTHSLTRHSLTNAHSLASYIQTFCVPATPAPLTLTVIQVCEGYYAQGSRRTRRSWGPQCIVPQ
jgi:hypothetical protein